MSMISQQLFIAVDLYFNTVFVQACHTFGYIFVPIIVIFHLYQSDVNYLLNKNFICLQPKFKTNFRQIYLSNYSLQLLEILTSYLFRHGIRLFMYQSVGNFLLIFTSVRRQYFCALAQRYLFRYITQAIVAFIKDVHIIGLVGLARLGPY